ncbi:MAG: hypothetical protein WDN06_12880 [Asticcacaulis sp.]
MTAPLKVQSRRLGEVRQWISPPAGIHLAGAEQMIGAALADDTWVMDGRHIAGQHIVLSIRRSGRSRGKDQPAGGEKPAHFASCHHLSESRVS